MCVRVCACVCMCACVYNLYEVGSIFVEQLLTILAAMLLGSSGSEVLFS